MKYLTDIRAWDGVSWELSDLRLVCFLISSVENNSLTAEALILALMYTYSQVNRGKKIKFFVVSFDAKYLPYVTLFLTWILESPQAMILQAVGIPAAHLYDFLTLLWPTFGGGKNIVQTPSFLARWFGSDRSVPHSITKRYGTAIRPVDQPPRASSSGFGSSLSGIWGNRGQGRRLGGD